MKHQLINGWTKAEAIETLREHLPSDGSRCMEDDSCVYENKHGERCAAGAFIEDDMIRETESGLINNVVRHYPWLATKLPLDARGMERLQSEHDCARDSAVEACVEFIEKECEE